MEDLRLITTGNRIPSELYSDQPYIIVADDGTWVCEVTTAEGHEGAAGTHILITRSKDMGKTWCEPFPIEPARMPESAYGVLLKTGYGRIYCFYDYNKDDLRYLDTFAGPKSNRVDMQGYYVYRFSDDHGETWSDRYEVPIRESKIDRENVYKGAVRIFWNVGRPWHNGREVFIPIHKIRDMLTESEGWFVYSANIDTERDPEKILWETLPDGDVGLRTPPGGGLIAEEQSIVGLSDGSLCCVYRTVDGYAAESYSRDNGHTWEAPRCRRFADGRRMRHNRAANFTWRLKNGKYLYWFNNQGSKDYRWRNPVFLSGGVEVETPRGLEIQWSQPEIVLYDEDPESIISYPDLIEDKGRVFISQTQKKYAYVNEIDPSLLKSLWGQFGGGAACDQGLLAEAKGGGEIDLTALPDLSERYTGDIDYRTRDLRAGYTLEFWLEPKSLAKSTLLDSRGSDGAGFLITAQDGKLQIRFGDGRMFSFWESDAIAAASDPVHAAIVIDGGPKTVSVIVNGAYQDGGDARPFGWGFYNPYTLHAKGAQRASVPGGVLNLRLYGRALRTGEIIGNYRAGQTRR